MNIKTITLALALTCSQMGSADVLLIDRVESKSGLNLPGKSQTMDQVRSQFGDPISESSPVGEPPITQWEYADFIVYFEYSHVITSVVKKSKPTEQGPKSPTN